MIEHALTAVTRILTGAVASAQGFDFYPPSQRIYYANHTSHLDTILLWSLIPRAQRAKVHPVAARDYWWSSPWKRYLAERVLRAVPLTRQRRSVKENPLAELEEMLRRGESLILFPEGTRGPGSDIQPFKSGLYHLAVKYPHVQLVPAYINNLNRVLPKGEFIPVPILCTVHFGAPFTVEPNESRAAFIERAHARLAALAPR